MTLSDTQKKIISNKSKTYLLPLISKDVSIEFDYLLINTYLKFNKSIGDIDYPFALLYEIEDTEAFWEYDRYLATVPLFHSRYDVGDMLLYIFRFPDKYKLEYSLFKEGKYSKFDTEAKGLIMSYSAEAYKYPPLIEDIAGVLWKHKSRRLKIEKDLGMTLPESCELASKIEFDNETFLFNE